MMASPALLDLGVAFVAVAVAAALAVRVGLSVIPAYILAGVVVGPNPPRTVLGVDVALVESGALVAGLAELGVVLLLFFLGLEFSVDKLLRDRRRVVAAGLVDLAVNFTLGLLVALAFGLSLLAALFVAGIVYISSSAVVTKSLLERGWIANPEADPILGTLVFEDLAIAVYLAVLSAVLGGGGGGVAAVTGVARAFAFLGALALVAWAGTGLVVALLDHPTDEVFLLQVLGAVTLVAGAALLAGASEAVAAFFVGAALSGSDLVDRLETLVSPLRDVFAAVFFFAIGLGTDLALVADVAPLLVAAVAVTTLGKFASGITSGRVYGLSATRSVRTALALVPRGEFSLVVAALAATAGGEVAGTVPAFAVGYVLAMTVLGALLLEAADPLTRALAPRLGM